jgi:redox-sensitive bicupin YhaK (pirin superfamily)
MITTRPAAQRGHFDHGWLDTSHSFSFADYHDPQHMGFRSLRVINEDRVQPGEEFGTHGHRDMEILTWVLEGRLAHKDNMGNGSIIKPGEAQRMTAGTGVMHSEANPSAGESVHFLQIWILPEGRGLPPGYEQKSFADAHGLRLIASHDGREGSVTVHQDADVWLARLKDGETAELPLRAGRGAWVQVARGGVEVRAGGKGVKLEQGDGASVEGEASVMVAGRGECEAIVFDLG